MVGVLQEVSVILKEVMDDVQEHIDRFVCLLFVSVCLFVVRLWLCLCFCLFVSVFVYCLVGDVCVLWILLLFTVFFWALFWVFVCVCVGLQYSISHQDT